MQKGMLILTSCLLAACTAPAQSGHRADDLGQASDGSDGPPSAADGSVGVDGGLGEDGPTILSFGTNVTELTQNESVRFVAVVTVAGGLDQLAGGHLTDVSGAIDYGAFQATTQSSYQFDLAWWQLNQASPISFELEEQRSFVAQFFDVNGGSTTRLVTLRLHCGGDKACSGTCTDLTDRDHCGACDIKLDDDAFCAGGEPRCFAAGAMFCAGTQSCVNLNWDTSCGACGNVCATGTECYDQACRLRVASGGDKSCNQICAGHGQTCVEAIADFNVKTECSVILDFGGWCACG